MVQLTFSPELCVSLKTTIDSLGFNQLQPLSELRLGMLQTAECCSRVTPHHINKVWKTIHEEKHWRWYRLGEEEEEDRSRDGWTVSTD